MKMKKFSFNISTETSSSAYVVGKVQNMCIMLRYMIDYINNLDIYPINIKYGYLASSDNQISELGQYWYMNNSLLFDNFAVEVVCDYSSFLETKIYSDNTDFNKISHFFRKSSNQINGNISYRYNFYLFYNEKEYYLFDDSAVGTLAGNSGVGTQYSTMNGLFLGYNGTDFIIYNHIFKNCNNEELLEIARYNPTAISSYHTLLMTAWNCTHYTKDIVELSDIFSVINKGLNEKSIYIINNNYYYAFYKYDENRTMLLNCGKDLEIEDTEMLEINDSTRQKYAKYITITE